MCVSRDESPHLEGGGSRAGCARGLGNAEAPRELPAGTATEEEEEEEVKEGGLKHNGLGQIFIIPFNQKRIPSRRDR